MNVVEVGTVIRQRLEPGTWREGVIERVWRNKYGRRLCAVKYENGVPPPQEWPVDEALDLWVAVQTMWDFHRPPKIDTIPLFERHNNPAKPYTLDQCLELLQYSCQVLGGLTLEALEGHRFVRTMSIPTEVYGRMLPRAIDVRYTCIYIFLNEKALTNTYLFMIGFISRKFSGNT